MEHIGLVGLPNSGKSTLFNALTGAATPVAAHPFTTTETATGIAHLPDRRLAALAEMSASRKVVEAGVEFADIAGLVKGSSSGEGLGNRFLAGIRETDAICLVLRAFDDPEIPGESDPAEALAVLEMELILADMASLEGQLERRRKTARSVKPDAAGAGEIEAMETAYKTLSAGEPLYRSEEAIGSREQRRNLFLLTDKPVLAVVNLGEEAVTGAGEGLDSASGSGTGVQEKALTGSGTGAGSDSAPQSGAGVPAGVVAGVAEALGGHGEVVGLCAELEAEAAIVDPAERGELLEGLGMGEGALARVAAAAYALLGRETFLTTGEKESRAWSFRAGSTAPECAGVIHSDLQRGFIKAEVIGWEELLQIGSWSEARHRGRLRLEGKDYIVKDGDVLEIRFNV